MAQVSIGNVENLEDLVRGLASVDEALASACSGQFAAAEELLGETEEEAKNSEDMLQDARRAELGARQDLLAAEEDLDAAIATLSSCEAQPEDEDGHGPDCSSEEAHVAAAEYAVAAARAALEQVTDDRMLMERRVECANQALSMGRSTFEQTRSECAARLNAVAAAIQAGRGRLLQARQTLKEYLATDVSAARFSQWLQWIPERGTPITPDKIRDRMSLSTDQLKLQQQYIYERVPSFRSLVDRCRSDWARARGDVERNLVDRKIRIHLSGEFAEQLARQALAPLGGKIETQGRTSVGDGGRYTKTDLYVADLCAPVILGCGESMGAPAGGSLAFEVKCGKPEYLYGQKEHMAFQAEGHKRAHAHCTLCSRDIHELPAEKEEELRAVMRRAGSPLVGMLPSKNEIDRICLEFVRQGGEDERE